MREMTTSPYQRAIFKLSRRQQGCAQPTSSPDSYTARRPMRSSVLPPSWRRLCRLISAVSLLTAAALPCRPPARGLAYLPMPGAPRSLLEDGQAFQRRGRSRTSSQSASLSRGGDRGVYMSACMSAGPSTIVLRALRVYKSGSPPEGLFPPGPAHSRRSSYTGVSGVRNGVRISWRHGVPTGAQGRDLPDL
jgi:hypothetical protein